MKTKRIGDVLVEEDMITQEQLMTALEAQKTSRKTLGATLIELNYISEETLYHFLAIQHGMEYVDISKVTVPPEVVRICPEEKARRLMIFPLEKDGNQVKVAISNPEDPSLLHMHYELIVEPSTEFTYVLANENAIRGIIDRHFAQAEAPAAKSSLEETIREVMEAGEEDDGTIEILKDEKIGADDDSGEEEKFEEGPLIKMCNYIIESAISKRASDIHLNVWEKRLYLRYRIDGTMIEFPAPPFSYKRALSSRYKIMGKLDPMERRKAQDGRIKYMFQGRQIDLRISILPSIWGENVVMRIIDQTAVKLDINDIGFLPEQLAAFQWAYRTPYGMILVTGPTACGKTTTLYAALNAINDPRRNIMTVEDPVEFRLPHIIQIQVNPGAGLTFANVLRSFLRQDPNVMMVGEIRDGETADIAIKASLTGHLVLSTIHTNNAPATINRLMDMGIDPMYVGTSVLVVASQKLLRRICVKCRAPWTPTEEDLKNAHLTPEDIAGGEFFKGTGCEDCNKTGYKGRLAVYEVLKVNATVRRAIFGKANMNEMRDCAKKVGMKSMREVAVIRWKEGLTTLDEVLAETQIV